MDSAALCAFKLARGFDVRVGFKSKTHVQYQKLETSRLTHRCIIQPRNLQGDSAPDDFVSFFDVLQYFGQSYPFCIAFKRSSYFKHRGSGQLARLGHNVLIATLISYSH